MKAKFYNDISRRYSQENNCIEIFLKKLKASGDSDFYTESCGCSAACTAAEVVGYQLSTGSLLSADSLLWATMQEFYNGVTKYTQPANRYYTAYADVLFKLYRVKAVPFETLDLAKLPADNAAIVASVHLKRYNGNHYVCVTSIENGLVTFFDSWNGNKQWDELNMAADKLVTMTTEDFSKIANGHGFLVYQ